MLHLSNNFSDFRNYTLYSILSFLMISIDANLLFSGNQNSTSFFPLSIGNTWITRDVSSQPNPAFFKHQVLDTIRIENKLYYEVDLFGPRFFREDSLGRFYEYKDSTEQIIMDFSMSKGDSIPISNGAGYTYCVDRKAVETFIGTQDEEIHFMLDWDSIIIDEEQTFILQRGVGIVVFKEFFHVSEYLVGAIIDGVVYGDTNVVSVEEAKNETPRHFSLSQNYPNPFNPSTTIRFDLPKATFVTLKIYNLLGEELETLVQEYRLAGLHKIRWTAEGLSNGHYFYRLQAGEFVDTKKFILIK